jgi:hypothetical protein
MQRLANINVAEPRDDALIEQRRFEARLLAAARCRQHRGIEGVAERLGTKAAQQRLIIELVAPHQFHRTEAARIVKRHARTGPQMKYHVIVGEVLLPLMVVTAEVIVVVFGLAKKNMKRSGHTEMHEQDVARGQIDQQIFGAAAEARHLFALQPLRKVLGQRPAQIGAPNLDPRDAFAVHGGFEPAANRFDFRKLGHLLALGPPLQRG